MEWRMFGKILAWFGDDTAEQEREALAGLDRIEQKIAVLIEERDQARTWAATHKAELDKARDELVSLTKQRDHYKKACAALNAEISQTAGKALGYPWFKDDPENFPNADESWGVCIGEHVAETLVEELAAKYGVLKERDQPGPLVLVTYRPNQTRYEGGNRYAHVGHSKFDMRVFGAEAELTAYLAGWFEQADDDVDCCHIVFRRWCDVSGFAAAGYINVTDGVDSIVVPGGGVDWEAENWRELEAWDADRGALECRLREQVMAEVDRRKEEKRRKNREALAAKKAAEDAAKKEKDLAKLAELIAQYGVPYKVAEFIEPTGELDV